MYLIRLRLSLYRLRDHKYHLNLCDLLSPICDYDEATKAKTHYLLQCSNSMQNIENINPDF